MSFQEPWKRVRNSRKRQKSAQPQDVFCSTKFKILNKTILARWPAARPRCIPPAGGSFRALNPFQSQQTVSPIKHSARRLRSPCTHRLEGVPAPKTPDHAMEAISWRPTLRGLDAAILPKMDHSQGRIAAPEPNSSDLENCLSTDTEPCTIDRSIEPRSGERSCYPRYPHENFIQTIPRRTTLRCWGAVSSSTLNLIHDPSQAKTRSN